MSNKFTMLSISQSSDIIQPIYLFKWLSSELAALSIHPPSIHTHTFFVDQSVGRSTLVFGLVQVKSAAVALYPSVVPRATVTNNGAKVCFLGMRDDKAPLLVDGHTHGCSFNALASSPDITMMFISCQILLILLKAVCRLPYRCARLIWQPMNALRWLFCHELVCMIGRFSCVASWVARPHNSVEFSVLVPAFHVRGGT